MQTHFRVWNGTQWEMLIPPLNGDSFSIALDAQGNMAAAKSIDGYVIETYRPNR
jgi:hypothetical protein